MEETVLEHCPLIISVTEVESCFIWRECLGLIGAHLRSSENIPGDKGIPFYRVMWQGLKSQSESMGDHYN